MKGLQITVVPVALRPSDANDSAPPLQVSTLRPGGRWLSRPVTDPLTVLQDARQMLEDAVHPDLDVEGRLENVGVDYTSGAPHLLLTAVLPIAAAELDDSPANWDLLTPWLGEGATRASLLRLDPIRAAIAHYWRRELMQSTAAFDFLPRYFPAYQARSVYSSVWGENQADGNFQRWLSGARGAMGQPVCREVPDAEVRREAQTAFAERLAAATPGLAAATVTEQWDSRIIGTSLAVAALAGAKLIPAAALTGALVGAAIGWQRSRGAGRPPTWYTRTISRRADLSTWYPARPPAINRPPTYVQ